MAIEAFLVGTCGLSEHEAALTSWTEFTLRLKGHEKETQRKWELARWMAWQTMLLSPNIKPGNKPKTPHAFCPFPWEELDNEALKKKADQCKVTEDEKNELNRIFAEIERNAQQKG